MNSQASGEGGLTVRKPGDSDKLWLVVRSLKNAEGKTVSD
jgi:hypothetical protein